MKKIVTLIICLFLIGGVAVINSCKKDPKSVVLTADKTTVTKGGIVTLTTTWDGKAKWINYQYKKPNESAFSDGDCGNITGSYPFTLDSVGVYTFFSVAYACPNKGDFSKVKDCKGQTKSNEISITVTP